VIQARHQLGRNVRIADQNRVATDNASSTSSNQTTRPNSVGLPSLPLRMIAVCDSKMLATSRSPVPARPAAPAAWFG
jgi:hypothetical protein